MIELPGWNDLISVNGFCYSSSMGESPKLNIPLKTSTAPTKGIAPATFTRNSTATYIEDGLVKTAGIDIPRFQNGRYLCEPAATNLFLQSGTPATQTITVVSGTIYTVQCYGSGSITLSGAGTGSVVEGTPITFTASSTSLICDVSGSLNRAQVETGTQATSYIPTTSAPVTRAADVLYYAVGDSITQGQGSLYCEFVGSVFVSESTRRILTISDNTYNNRISIFLSTSGSILIFGITAGIIQLSYSGIPMLLGLNKVLCTYEDNSIKFYVNGSLLYTDTSCIIPTNLTKLNVGCNQDGTGPINSDMGNVKYFKEVLTPAQAIKITTL